MPMIIAESMLRGEAVPLGWLGDSRSAGIRRDTVGLRTKKK